MFVSCVRVCDLYLFDTNGWCSCRVFVCITCFSFHRERRVGCCADQGLWRHAQGAARRHLPRCTLGARRPAQHGGADQKAGCAPRGFGGGGHDSRAWVVDSRALPAGTWPLPESVLCQSFCTRISYFICKQPLSLGTPLTAPHRSHYCAM